MNFFVSDLHFGHKNILKFERWQFADIEEHDQFIIDSINRIVRVTDTLYILGDIGNMEKLAYIHCRKIILLGNHDKRPFKEYEAYAAEVYDKPIYITNRLVLSHHPIPVTQGVLNVHGHLHGSYLASMNHFNVSIGLIDYTPVPYDKIGTKVGNLVKDNTEFLEEWYADLYIFTNPERRNDIVTDENGLIKVEESKRLRANMVKDHKGFVVDVMQPEIHKETGLPIVKVMNIVD